MERGKSPKKSKLLGWHVSNAKPQSVRFSVRKKKRNKASERTRQKGEWMCVDNTGVYKLILYNEW